VYERHIKEGSARRRPSATCPAPPRTIPSVAAWRREAIETFPELRSELNNRDEIVSVYELWFALLPLARTGHRESNDDLLTRIYDYAEWCWRHGGDLENAVAVTFYEHLFDERWMRALVVPWLSESVIRGVRPLWEARLTDEELDQVSSLLRNGPSRRAR
jgi:hypothetical protein